MSLSPGESATFVLLVPVNFRFALRRRTCPPHARPSSSESRVADSHSRVRRRVRRATANDPRRYRRLREKHEEPRRAATLSDRLTNPSPSINRLAASVVVMVAVVVLMVVATFLPPFIPSVGSDSLLTTLVSERPRACARYRVRLHEDFRLHVRADSRRRRAKTDVSGLQNSRARRITKVRCARIRRNEIFCELQIKDI